MHTVPRRRVKYVIAAAETCSCYHRSNEFRHQRRRTGQNQPGKGTRTQQTSLPRRSDSEFHSIISSDLIDGVLLLFLAVRRFGGGGEAPPAAAAAEAAAADAASAHLRPRAPPHQDWAAAQPRVEGPPLLRRPHRRVRPRHLPHIGTV